MMCVIFFLGSLFRFIGNDPTLGCTMGAATALFATISPELAIAAAKYIIIGGRIILFNFPNFKVCSQEQL